MPSGPFQRPSQFCPGSVVDAAGDDPDGVAELAVELAAELVDDVDEPPPSQPARVKDSAMIEGS